MVKRKLIYTVNDYGINKLLTKKKRNRHATKLMYASITQHGEIFIHHDYIIEIIYFCLPTIYSLKTK
jgi:hypothetical protein